MSLPKAIVSIDVGQMADYTAITVIQVKESQDRVTPIVIHLERLPLKTPYPIQVSRIKELILKLNNLDVYTVLDVTGVGKAVQEMFMLAGVRPTGILITGGDKVDRDGNIWKVPKKDLISALQLSFMSKEMKISGHLVELDTLLRELENFRMKISASGNVQMGGWRDSDHDDMVLSVAMGIWYCNKMFKNKSGSFHIVGGRRSD